MTTTNDQRQFIEHLERAAAIVATWPKWKQNILEASEDCVDYEQKSAKAISLIRRSVIAVYDAAASLKTCNCINDEQRFTRAMQYLEGLAEIVGDRAPDANWWRDYYELDGTHMQLTEEGWVPADQNTREATGVEPMEVLDEVNKPISSAYVAAQSSPKE